MKPVYVKAIKEVIRKQLNVYEQDSVTAMELRNILEYINGFEKKEKLAPLKLEEEGKRQGLKLYPRKYETEDWEGFGVDLNAKNRSIFIKGFNCGVKTLKKEIKKLIEQKEYK